MKNIVFLLAFLVGCASVPIGQATSASGTVDVRGASKKQIYQKALQWLTYKFVSGKAVVDYKDPDAGRIIAKGDLVIPMQVGSRAEVHVIATIDCVAGRSRIMVEATDCASVAPNGTRWPCTSMYVYPSSIEEIKASPVKFVEDFRDYMTGGSAPAWDGR